MTAAIEVGFLVISLVSLMIQVGALARIRDPDTSKWTAAHHGILRTAWCRVAASLLYVALGAITLAFSTTVEPLLVFGLVQVMWQLNAIADVRLRRYLDGHGRAPMRLSITARRWTSAAAIVGGLTAIALYLNLRL